MPILPAGQRRYLFEKKQQYLFSYDIVFDTQRGYMVSTPTGLRMHLLGSKDEEATEGRVYHVLDDRKVQGNDAVNGDVFSLETAIVVPEGAESGLMDGTMIVRLSPDDGFLYSFFEGAVALGPSGGERLRTVPPARLGDQEARAFLTTRLETSNPKYKWLTQGLCAGFGTLTIKGGKFTRGTFDIYTNE